MSNTHTTNKAQKNTQTKEGCCGGHDDDAKKHNPATTNARIEVEAIPDDQDNAVEHHKSGCCCGGKKHA